VKVGDGAFMKTLDSARELAKAMRGLGERAGLEVVCELTDMDQPLGAAVGNALEVREAVATLRGEGPPDFTELVLVSAAHLLALSDLDVGHEEARRRAEAAIGDGSAVEAYGRWIRAQGGDPDEGVLPTAPIVHEIKAETAGFVRVLGAVRVGIAALHMGAGRRAKGDEIDHSVGVMCRAKRGDRVEPGDVLAEIQAPDDASAANAATEVAAAYELGPEAPEPRPIILETIA
jgi:pyrimidine-nucleoside phosphorylase